MQSVIISSLFQLLLLSQCIFC